MLEKYDDLNRSKEFKLVCTLENGDSVTIRFFHRIHDSLRIDTDFFGREGSCEVMNSFQVLMNISLSLPVTLKLDNSGCELYIKPGTLLKLNS